MAKLETKSLSFTLTFTGELYFSFETTMKHFFSLYFFVIICIIRSGDITAHVLFLFDGHRDLILT